jgi:hypothetical protein
MCRFLLQGFAMRAAGVEGAALIIFNKSIGKVMRRISAALALDSSTYVRHYAALDPYSPLLDGSWKKLSECLRDRLLRSSEWYNDFILTCGVRDILGARLVDTSGHCVIFDLQTRLAECGLEMHPTKTKIVYELATAKYSCTKAPSLGTHLSAIRSAPTSTAPLDESDGIRDKFDYV